MRPTLASLSVMKMGLKGDVVFNGSEPEAGTDVANDATGATASVFNYTAKVI